MRRDTALLLTLLASLSLPALLPAQEADGYRAWYERIRDHELPADGWRTLSGVELRRDAGVLAFDRGHLRFLEGPGGVTWGAVFVGEGRLRLTPPIAVERDQLRRLLEVDSVDAPFEGAVLMFTDLTRAELEESSQPVAGAVPDGVRDEGSDELEEAVRYVSDDEGWVRRDLLVPLLNGGPGYFYAHVAEDRDEPLIFSVDPYRAEEVTLSRRGEGRGRPRQLVLSFHRESDYATGRSLPEEALDLAEVGPYDIALRVEGNLDVQGRATATVRPRAVRHSWIPFYLHADLEVDSVVRADGRPVTWARGEERGDVWIDLPDLGPEGIEVTFHYHGDVMDQVRNLFVEMKTFRGWYPVHEFDRPARFRLAFDLPEDYRVATVGQLLSDEVEDGRRRMVFETGEVRLMAFNLGEFEATRIDDPRIPPITVLLAEKAHREIRGLTFDYGVYIPQQEDMAGAVGSDLANAFLFCQEVYGPPPVSEFVASEIPTGHGEAYPGLVLLSWATFQRTSEKGFDEMFRAHEVAHQWWGIGVRPATDRDRWLAEGFSEFTGLWYAARARGSVDLYRKRLAETREEILDRRGEAAPIALGTRVATDRVEDYGLVVYQKGAWVLHMLRTLMTDPHTGDDTAFAEMVKEFYQAHRTRPATTGDLQRAAEGALGADMGWFFDQWVRSSHVPTYTFAHRYEDQPDGSVKARVRVRQDEVPEDFRMIVPILLDFGAEGTAVVRIHVTGPVTEADLPLLPRRPERIVFNPYESVLAEVKTEDWR